jgi:hypothetical protein
MANAYRRMASGRIGPVAPGMGDSVAFMEGGGYHGPDAMRQLPAGTGVLGSRSIKLNIILLFFIAMFQAVIVLLFLMIIFWVSAHKAEIQNLMARAEVVSNLARNVNDATQVLRRVMGDAYIESVSQNILWSKDQTGGHAPYAKVHRWLEPRSEDEEALITDKAANEIVQGIHSAINLLRQVDESHIVGSLTKMIDDLDGVVMTPKLHEFLGFATRLMTKDAQVQTFARTSVELLTHFETVLLPMVSSLSEEMGRSEDGLGPKTLEEEIWESQQMRARLREFGAIAKEIGEGLHDLMQWYRRGGPADAVALGADMIKTSRELIESPAAESLVRVLEGIDWRETGDYVSEAMRDVTAILGDIHDSGAVASSDEVFRAVSGVLNDPAMHRVLDVGPGIADQFAKILAQPNVQQMITHLSALIRRVERLVSEAEHSKTVERSSEFLSMLHRLLGGLVHGGLHLELGDKVSPISTDNDNDNAGRGYHHYNGTSLGGPTRLGRLPVSAIPERQRHYANNVEK